MNIFFVIPYVPSLVRVRPYQLIRHIKERGHRIILATIWTSEKEHSELEIFSEFYDEVISIRQPVVRSLLNCGLAIPTTLPLQSVYSWNRKLYEQIEKRIFSFGNRPPIDIVHIEHLRGSQYGVHLKQHTSNQIENRNTTIPPIVWDSVDCISHLFKQASEQSRQRFKRRITQFDLHRTERREGWLANKFDQVLVTSQKDKNALSNLAAVGSSEIQVLPNGVDLNYFEPNSIVEREDATLVISGKMSYHANVNMVLFLVNQVMPIVWKAQPNVKLWVVGKDPTPEIMDLAKLPTVIVTGTVESLLPYLQTATISVAPIQYGAGIQNKVLEAMACATPVIASSLATSALDVKSGHELIIADSPDEWVISILELIDSPQKQSKIGQAGRQYVQRNHRWSEIAGQLENIYQGIIDAKH